MSFAHHSGAAGGGGGGTFAAPTQTIEIGDALVAGVSGDGLRSDAQFPFTAPAAGYPVDVAAAEADGVDTAPARADHRHAHGAGYLANAHHNQAHDEGDHTAAGVADIADVAAAESAGVAVSVPRGDHVHAHGSGYLANAHHNQAHDEGDHTVAGVADLADVAAAESAGVAVSVPRGDHVHAHGSGYLANAHHNQAHATAHEPAGADTMAVDAAAGTGSLRTIGAGALAAAAGNHTHAGGAGDTIVRKTADETVNNSAVLQNDDALLLAIPINEVWEFELTLYVDSVGASPDFDFDLTGPTGATGRYAFWGSDNNGAVGRDAGSALATEMRFPFAAGFDFCQVMIWGFISQGANAGNLQLRWAQGAATAEDTKVLANSTLKARKIS